MKKIFGALIATTLLMMAGCSCATDIKKMEDLETRIQTLENVGKPAVDKNATASLEQTTAQSGAESAIPETPTKRDVQAALKNAGFYNGEVDGKFGSKSKKSVEDFKTANGLKADGKVGPNTWDKLKMYLNATTAAQTVTTQTVTTQEKK